MTPASSAIQYDFLAPGKILFGWGRRAELGSLARQFGRQAVIVWGSHTLADSDIADELTQTLTDAGITTHTLTTISHEPEPHDVDAAAARLRACAEPPVLIAIGGGSAIDLAKAAAVMATNGPAPVIDFLEGVGRGLAITHAPLPVIAMPTTAGTGSEATKNSVLSSYDPPFKKSLRSEQMIPRAVLVDPELAISLPPATTAHSGIDAVTQLIESFISRRAKPIPRALAIDGLRLALPALPQAICRPHERQPREAMAHAALLSGLALANSGLGLAHGVAAALGAHARVAHGLACGFMLPIALRANRSVAGADYAELGAALGLGAGEQAADAFVNRIESLCRDIGLPTRLADLHVRREQIPEIVRGSHGNSLDANPRLVTDDELTRLLHEAF